MRWLAVMVVAACRFDFDAVPDAAGTGDGTSDSGTTCWAAWRAGTIRFGAPARLVELEAGHAVANPVLSNDGLGLIFDRVNNGFDLFSAHREARGMPWHTITALDTLNSTDDEGRAAIADGPFIVFSSTRNSQQSLWTSTRVDGGAFSAPTQDFVGALNAVQTNPIDPELAAGGLHLYDAPVEGTTQSITLSRRDNTSAAFGTPVALTELSVSSAVGDPSLSPDELVIVFSSGVTSDGNDLYYAVRSSTADPFGTPHLVPDVNSPVDDHDVEVAKDGCELLWFSSRDAPGGALYAAVPR